MDSNDVKQAERLICYFAWKVLRRVHALGAHSVQFDDVKSELYIAWCKARDSYDESAGASFKTYLMNGMRLHINRWVESNFERFHGQTVAMSLESQPEEDGGTLQEIIADVDAVDPSETVAQRDHFEQVYARLSDRARMFVDLLRDPPEPFVQEARTLREKAKFSRKLGMRHWVNTEINKPMIFRVMGASRSEVTRIIAEIDNATKEVESYAEINS